jgi:hypothetical protein
MKPFLAMSIYSDFKNKSDKQNLNLRVLRVYIGTAFIHSCV